MRAARSSSTCTPAAIVTPASTTPGSESDAQLTITFDVRRGPRYVLESVRITGNTAVPVANLQPALRCQRRRHVHPGQRRSAVGAIRNIYRTRGFTRAEVRAKAAVLPASDASDANRRVDLEIAVVEGPRTVVGTVSFRGNSVVTEAELTDLLRTVPGRPIRRCRSPATATASISSTATAATRGSWSSRQ